jgi:TetR/AcrR family transcriptional repressor of nem operon
MNPLNTTAEQILDCAQGLMIEMGYNGFSYADVAQRVAISKPSIHHHFPTKAQLALKVVQRYRSNIAAALEEGARSLADPAQQLGGYIGYWSTCIMDGTTSFCVCAMLASEQRTLPPEVAAEIAGHFTFLAEWLADVLARGQADGQFVLQRDAALEAQCFMASIHGAMLSARALGEGAVFAAVAQAALARLTAPAAH